MATLADQIKTPESRSAFVDECDSLLTAEVGRRRGLSGLATKGAFALVGKVKPGFIRAVIDGLLDDFLAALQPFHDEWKASPEGTCGEHLTRHASAVAHALLAITDARADRTKFKAVEKAYRKLRPTAVDQIVESMPALGSLADRHLSP